MSSTSGKKPSNSDTTKMDGPRNVFFFPHIRTASHVLCRLLSNQPGWVQSDYHFFEAFNFARESFGWGLQDGLYQKNRDEFEKLLQKGFDEIQHDRKSAADQNKNVFLKEHTFYVWEPTRLLQSMWGWSMEPSFTVVDTTSSGDQGPRKTNPTIFPDRFLKSWRPLFLIRHPALSFESWYRAESSARHVDIFDKQWAFYTSFQYSRQMYDWFLSEGTDSKSVPIVVDADDMLENSSTINTLCGLLDMDTQYILKEWDSIRAPENAGTRELSYMSGYWNSTSVDRSKSSKGLDMAVKRGVWQKDFGLDIANELERLIEKALPDYEYLKGKRI